MDKEYFRLASGSRAEFLGYGVSRWLASHQPRRVWCSGVDAKVQTREKERIQGVDKGEEDMGTANREESKRSAGVEPTYREVGSG